MRSTSNGTASRRVPPAWHEDGCWLTGDERQFFGLAFLSALNPKLLALDLLLIENRLSRAMFLCLLLGGMAVALTVGLLDVLVVRADAIHHQASVRALGLDLALGLLLLAAGGLLATGCSHGPAQGVVPAGEKKPK